MVTTKALLIVAAVSASSALYGQQSPNPQPAQPQADPCLASQNTVRIHVPNRLQQMIAKQQQKLAAQGGFDLDLNKTLRDATAPKPCIPAPATKPPAPKPTATAVTSTPASPMPVAKPTYVCPPKSTLIPNYAYCIYPDQTVVDAIPLPAKVQQAIPNAPK